MDRRPAANDPPDYRRLGLRQRRIDGRSPSRYPANPGARPCILRRYHERFDQHCPGRTRTVLLCLFLTLVAELWSYITISKESSPDVNIPIMYVLMTHQGISPEDAERMLIRPMERELRSIEGVKEMRATAYEGGANIILGSGSIKLLPGRSAADSLMGGRTPSMSDLFWLSERQLAKIEPYFPLSHGVPRVDDRRVISGIVHVIRNGLRWRDAPPVHGPHKTLYNRFVRWSRLGVFSRIFAALTGEAGPPNRLMIDATHLKAHRTAASLYKKGLFPDVSDAQKAG